MKATGLRRRCGRVAGNSTRSALRIVRGLALLAAATALPAAAQALASAVEYYHAGFDHFFVTAYPSEIALLDGGGFGGAWVRTGHVFQVWAEPGAGTVGTCRFFSASFAPKSSHFYTPYAQECAALQQGGTWTYEAVAFHLKLTDASGACPAGSAPLYRLYNNGAGDAPNHRYTSSRAVFDQMRVAGWTPEGGGPQIVFACLPGSGGATDAIGLWAGTTGRGEDVTGIVLSDGSFYFLYAAPDATSRMGTVHGTGAFANGSFQSSSARDYEFVPSGAAYPANASGSYVAGRSMSGTIGSAARTTTIALRPVPGLPPMDMPAAPLSFTGGALTLDGATLGNVVFRPDGSLSGNLLGCTLTGMVVRRSDVRAGDATIAFGGAMCPLGSGTMSGVALYEYQMGVGALVIFAHDASQTDAFTFGGFVVGSAEP